MESIIVKPFRFIVLLLGIIPLILSFVKAENGYFYDCPKGVVIKTGKNHYESRESIDITLTNNLKESIYSHIGSDTPVFTIEHIERKNTDSVWDTLFAQCRYPECVHDSDAPLEVKPGYSVTFEWNPMIYIDGSPEYVTAEPGRYRLLILYMNADRNEWKSEYSTTFLIE